MAIEKTNEVDTIGVDNQTGRVILSIVDGTDWSNEQNHLILLQEKINKYLSFIESGEVYSSYPSSEGRNFEIKIFAKHSPTQNALNFLNKVDKIIVDAGFKLSWKVMELE